jgi:hypothetical protein
MSLRVDLRNPVFVFSCHASKHKPVRRGASIYLFFSFFFAERDSADKAIYENEQEWGKP